MDDEYTAAIYNFECQVWQKFASGPHDEVMKAAMKMSELTMCSVLTHLVHLTDNDDDEEGEDGFDGSHQPIAVVKSKRQDGSVLKQMQTAKVELVGGHPTARYTYTEHVPDEYRCRFQPCLRDGATTQFEIGQVVLFAVFHDNCPGGWTLVDEGLTHAEYWQDGYLSNAPSTT